MKATTVKYWLKATNFTVQSKPNISTNNSISALGTRR